MRSGRKLVWCLLVAAAACDAGSNPEQPIETFSEDLYVYVEGVCRWRHRCQEPETRESLDDCRTMYSTVYCGDAFATIPLPMAAACATKLDTFDCNTGSWPEECLDADSTLQGVGRAAYGFTFAAVGEACGQRTLCGRDLFCTAGELSCGTCLPVLEQGEACEPNISGQCQSGLYCSDARRCEPTRDDGQACERSDQCTSAHCADGRCFDYRRFEEGRACTEGWECGPEGQCRDDVCVRRTKLGGACGDDSECSSGFCVEGRCSELSGCLAGALGGPCGDDSHCAGRLVCGDESRCREPLADGMPCERLDAPCARGSRCNLTHEQPTCQPIAADGEPCDAPGQPDARCLSFYCQADSTCGAECS